jgi:hypothetical protein
MLLQLLNARIAAAIQGLVQENKKDLRYDADAYLNHSV